MVFVFGLDVPLFELMIVFFVVLTACLIFIMIELRKSTKVLHALTILTQKSQEIVKEEEVLLSKLEEDLHVTRGSAYDKVVRMVKDALERGISETHIEKTLMNSGWKKAQIEKIVKTVKEKIKDA